MNSKQFSRRDFLRKAGFGAAALLGTRLIGFKDPKRASRGLFDNMATMTPDPSEPFVPDVEFLVSSVEKTIQLLPGTPTRVFGYEGEILNGPVGSLVNLPNCSLGPVIRVKSGTKVRINYYNNLAEESVIHPHGLDVPEDCDGSPMQAIMPGETKVYDFQVIDHAGPYWFHPHPMGKTATEVYQGMAGVFYVWDDAEAMAVPGASTGENDIPVIIQDRILDSNNQLVYSPNMMYGMLGNRVMVTNMLSANYTLEPRAYRLRLLNGSNARTYKIAWSNGMPLTVIGSDCGLLPQAVTRSYLMLAPGERADIWVDFRSLAGQQVILRSLAFDISGCGCGSGGRRRMGQNNTQPSTDSQLGVEGMMGGGMGGMGGGLPFGSAMDIMVVKVGRTKTKNPVLGPLPPLSIRYDASNVPNYNSPWKCDITMGMGMMWLLNGRTYEMDVVADDEMFMKDVNLVWEFTNNTPIAHPMHLHTSQFQVVERASTSMSGYSTVNQGFVESGWKDTVLVLPNDRVKIAVRFGPYTGMYMYHCHILEHEDMGMMRNFMIMDPM